MLRNVDPFESGKTAHPDVVELRQQKRIDEMPPIDGELRVIDRFLRDLESRWTRAEKSAASSPIQFHFRFPRSRHEVRQIEAEKIVPFDHVRIAFLDNGREPLERGFLGFLYLGRIDDNQFFPASVIRERDAHEMLALAGIIDPGYRQHFELEPAEFVELQTFEQRAPGVSEIMLHRIAEREKAAAGALQSIAQGDQFLPAIHADPPAVAQIAGELFGVDVQIGNVGIAPDEWVERLGVGDSRAILFPAINLHGPGIAELDRHDARRRVGSEKQRVFLESHGPATTRRYRGESRWIARSVAR